MTSFEDYEVLSILGTDLSSTCYKVKNKQSGELFVWKAINYESTDVKRTTITEKVNRRKSQKHNILLQVHDCIHYEETSTIYLVTDYCKHGSLFDVTRRCVKNGEYLEENLLWELMYKLACYFKLSDHFVLNLHEIFIDEECNIKLLNFTLTDDVEKSIDSLTNVLKALIFLEVTEFPAYYSSELHGLLKFLTKFDPGIEPTVDAILCHPTVLLKISHPRKENIFLKKPKAQEDIAIRKNPNALRDDFIKENLNNDKLESLYHEKLESLRDREATLRSNEEKLKERLHAVEKREKKVSLMERVVKEKTSRAELYLKRAREVKSTNSGKGIPIQKVPTLEKTDTSFSADCGDSVILPTSCKMNVQEISKPPKFTRTLSERRVRFKSHSPLKEIHNIKRDSMRRKSVCTTIQEQKKFVSKLEPIQSDSDRTSESTSDKCAEKTKKKFLLSTMFSKKSKKSNSTCSSSDSVSVHTYEDLDGNLRRDVEDCKPINWTEDSKKQAFDLLRIMNGEVKSDPMKHTYL